MSVVFTCATSGCPNEGVEFPPFEFPKPGVADGVMHYPPTYCGACGVAMTEQDQS